MKSMTRYIKERTGRVYKRQGDDRTGICTAEHH